MKKTNVLKNAILYPVYLILFLSLNKFGKDIPFSYALYAALLQSGASVFMPSLLFIVSFFVYKDFTTLIPAAIFSLLFSVVTLLYRKKKNKIGAESIIYVFCGLIFYLLYHQGGFSIEKLVYMSIIALFSIAMETAVCAIKYKKLSQSTSITEGISIIALYILSATGFINLFSVNIYKPICLFLFVLLSRYYKNSLTLLVAAVFSSPLVIVTGSHSYYTVFLTFGFAFLALKNAPPIILSIGLMFCELVFGLFLGFYGNYDYIDIVSTLTVFAISGFIPSEKIEALSGKYNFKPEDALIRSVITKNRTETSARLYEISNVFFQMQDAFLNLKKCTESTDELVDKMVEETIFNACGECGLKNRCIKNNYPKRETMEKIIRIGVSKGRISIVDLPRDFTDYCAYPNSTIFEVNRLIGSYYDYIRSAEGNDKSKDILSLQSAGVAEVLKSLAFSLSKTSAENKKEEKRILKALSRKNLRCEAALCYGEGDDTEIALFLPKETCDSNDVAKILSQAFSIKFSVSQSIPVSNEINVLTLKFAPKFDAAFGVSKITKNGSPSSGDCYSLIKVDESNFLVALSDGMGSGTVAEKTSETALNLIESLYKSGLKSEYILSLVNKLLAISIDDNFSAIDLALVDLREGLTSFIKIGSPYGFVLSESGIRYIEGSSLPLGILDELRPTVATTTLNSGDVIVMVSDGITDAFSSSSELIDFLKSAPLLNPQGLADLLVEQALILSGGTAEDDMTAVCVRLYNAA